MPDAWRVHVIEERLRAEGLRVPVRECDVYSLPPADRTRAVDVLIAERTSFPMVIVGERVVCHADLDLDAIVRAVREGFADASCCC